MATRFDDSEREFRHKIIDMMNERVIEGSRADRRAILIFGLYAVVAVLLAQADPDKIELLGVDLPVKLPWLLGGSIVLLAYHWEHMISIARSSVVRATALLQEVEILNETLDPPLSPRAVSMAARPLGVFGDLVYGTGEKREGSSYGSVYWLTLVIVAPAGVIAYLAFVLFGEEKLACLIAGVALVPPLALLMWARELAKMPDVSIEVSARGLAFRVTRVIVATDMTATGGGAADD